MNIGPQLVLKQIRVTANEDFDLYYSLSGEEIGLNLLSYREPGEDGFFMLLGRPKVEAQEVVAKDVILVLDTSGSMEGTKIAAGEGCGRLYCRASQPR